MTKVQNVFGTPSVISSVKRLAEDVVLARVIDLLFERCSQDVKIQIQQQVHRTTATQTTDI